MARHPIDPAAAWQTACWILRNMGVPTQCLKNLALDGLVRVKSDASRFPFRYYSVADVNRYIREAKRNGNPESERFRTVETRCRSKVRAASCAARRVEPAAPGHAPASEPRTLPSQQTKGREPYGPTDRRTSPSLRLRSQHDRQRRRTGASWQSGH
jgi:hypothetical protein